jgi:hypothetical protein
MASKFIPDSDADFEVMARLFSGQIAMNPAKYHVSAIDAATISCAVKAYSRALFEATQPGSRSMSTIAVKDTARARAEKVVRKFGRLIRANEDIEEYVKKLIGVRSKPQRLRRRAVPEKPPVLKLIGTVDSAHMLEFQVEGEPGVRAKPRGAARVEIYVDLVPVGEAPPLRPGLPGERATGTSGGPWYLRSYTTNPIRIVHPLPGAPDEPRLVVYWARWADATGEVGPWSRGVVARVEGWSGAAVAYGRTRRRAA